MSLDEPILMSRVAYPLGKGPARWDFVGVGSLAPEAQTRRPRSRALVMAVDHGHQMAPAVPAASRSGPRLGDFFLNADETECVILKTYANSEAVLDHVDNLGDVLDRLLGLGELSEEVFGDPSPQLREILAPLNSKIYTRLQGLYRVR